MNVNLVDDIYIYKHLLTVFPDSPLQLALNYCDYMVESYDVLVALVETEAGILAASEAASSPSSRQALSNRKSAEVVARHLVAR